MGETNSSMHNIFAWCLQNQMTVEFHPLADGLSVKVIFSKRVCGEWRSWSHAASIEHINQMLMPPNTYWSIVLYEAMKHLSEEKIFTMLTKGEQ